MAITNVTVEVPGFCKGISAGDVFEIGSQEFNVSVAPVSGEQIISYVGLFRNGTLSLSLNPLRLGTVVLNFTITDTGGTEHGALNSWSHTAQFSVTSNAAVNQPPFLSLLSFSSHVRDSFNDAFAFINITACAGPGDESIFQKSTLSFLTCSNGSLLGLPCNNSLKIVRSFLQGSAFEPVTGLLCPLWSIEYLVPRDFYGTSTVVANVTDEFGLSSLLEIPVIVQYVDNPPDFDVQPRNIAIARPEGCVSVLLSFLNITAGQSVFFDVIAHMSSQFSERPSLSSITYFDAETNSLCHRFIFCSS